MGSTKPRRVAREKQPGDAGSVRVDGQGTQRTHLAHPPRAPEALAERRIRRQRGLDRNGGRAHRRPCARLGHDEADVRQPVRHRSHTEIATRSDVHFATACKVVDAFVVGAERPAARILRRTDQPERHCQGRSAPVSGDHDSRPPLESGRPEGDAIATPVRVDGAHPRLRPARSPGRPAPLEPRTDRWPPAASSRGRSAAGCCGPARRRIGAPTAMPPGPVSHMPSTGNPRA